VTEAHIAFLSRGLRRLTPEGEMEDAAGDLAAIDGVDRLLVVDLEMSGPNPLVHEVLDIGGVIAGVEPGFPERESWGARVRPKRIGNAEHAALRVVGYSAKAWKDAMELEAAVDRLIEFSAGAAIAGWGIGQDMSFLWQTFRQLEREWPFAPVAIDVQPIAREVLKGTGSVDRFNLGHVADRLGIGRDGEHGALPDAFATYDVLVALAKRAAQAGP
jgi:DNA polymerase III subunit epsilon